MGGKGYRKGVRGRRKKKRGEREEGKGKGGKRKGREKEGEKERRKGRRKGRRERKKKDKTASCLWYLVPLPEVTPYPLRFTHYPQMIPLTPSDLTPYPSLTDRG